MVRKLKLNVLSILLIGASPILAEHATDKVESQIKTRPVSTTNVAQKVEEKEALNYGIRFTCDPAKLEEIKCQMHELLYSYGWDKNVVKIAESNDGKSLTYELNRPETETSTMDIQSRSELNIKDEELKFTDPDGTKVVFPLVSKKEIIASLLNPGRLSEFKGKQCSFEAMMDHVGARQSIAAAGRMANMKFTGANRSTVNEKYWSLYTEKDAHIARPGRYFRLKEGADLTDGLMDSLIAQPRYDVGCTIACDLIVSAGIMNYYKNLKKDPIKTKELEKGLGKDFLMTLEPTWENGPSVALERQKNIPAENWIAGDWGYVRNTDERSAEANYGDEGKNIVYIGNGRFSKYYMRAEPVTLDFNLKQVYQWRFDASNKTPFDPAWDALLPKFKQDPREGGLLRNVRDIPRIAE